MRKGLGRRGMFAVLVAACAVTAGAFVAWAAVHDRASDEDSPASGDVPGGDVVMFRSLDGAVLETFGQVAYAGPIASPRERTFTGMTCERVHYAGGRGICLKRTGALRYTARVFDGRFARLHELDLAGLPSRTRVSGDGRLGAITAFSSGHSYATPGQFSTVTTIVELVSGRTLGNLEKFAVVKEGKSFTSVDFNFWGVTFAADSNRFYATLGTRGTTYLVEGDVAARRLRVLRENVECPSLSPDGTRVAYKKRVGGAQREWRFHVLELATMKDQPLAETRAIDDQMEWLDGENVLYGVTEEIWTVPADGSGKARRFLDAADSPAVVRPGDATPR